MKGRRYQGGNMFVIRGTLHQFIGNDVEQIDLTLPFYHDGKTYVWDGKRFSPTILSPTGDEPHSEKKSTPAVDKGEQSTVGEEMPWWKQTILFYLLFYISLGLILLLFPPWLVAVVLLVFCFWIFTGYLRTSSTKDYRGEDK